MGLEQLVALDDRMRFVVIIDPGHGRADYSVAFQAENRAGYRYG
jgi:hypothetical protein